MIHLLRVNNGSLECFQDLLTIPNFKICNNSAQVPASVSNPRLTFKKPLPISPVTVSSFCALHPRERFYDFAMLCPPPTLRAGTPPIPMPHLSQTSEWRCRQSGVPPPPPSSASAVRVCSSGREGCTAEQCPVSPPSLQATAQGESIKR